MKSVFITGAGRGLGAYVSECLLKDNWRVFGSSRGGEFPKSLVDHPNLRGFLWTLRTLKNVTKPSCQQLKRLVLSMH